MKGSAFNRLKEAWKELTQLRVVRWIENLSFPVKFAFTALLGAIGSSGFVGLLTKFGAYWFALYYGIRAPADGIPYVGETAAVISFLILLGAAVAYSATFVVLTSVAWLLSRFETVDNFIKKRVEAHARHKNPGASEEHVASIVRSRVDTAYRATAEVLVAILVVTSAGIGQVVSNDNVALPSVSTINVVAVLVVFVLFAGQFAKAAFVAIAIAAAVVLSSFALWHPAVYAAFLRTIGYGGGVSVVVELDGTGDQKTERNQYLMLRTTTALLIYDGHTNHIEIPIDRMRSLRTADSAIWVLPPSRLSKGTRTQTDQG